MKKTYLYLLSLSICFGLCQCNEKSTEIPSPPNIILCMADDQGWGDMAYNGHPVLQTPNFDAMASEALRFDRFYAAAPVCSPTRGSVLTGRHPNRFGCFTWGGTLRPQEVTIAEVLKKTGYATGHFGKWHLGSVRQGSPVNPGASGFDEWLSAPNFYDNNPILSREGVAVQIEGESSMVVVDAALEFIHKNESAGNPYLAVVWFGSPHLLHEAIEEDREIYNDQPEEMRDFYGEITGMDRAFGKLRSEIRNLGSYENTILLYCSDNGGLPKYGSTGGRGYKGDIYEGGLRVPAILEWPAKIKEPMITAFPANTSDIFPTLIDIVGVDLDNQRPLDGISLVPLLEGQMKNRPKPMGFWQYKTSGTRTSSKKLMAELMEAQKQGNMVGDSSKLRLNDIQINTQYSMESMEGHAAWLDWPWKFHSIRDESGAVHNELYRLDNDPQESSDVLSAQPDLVLTMKSALEQWQKSVVNSMNGKDY